jgi:myosin heavy subunit
MMISTALYDICKKLLFHDSLKLIFNILYLARYTILQAGPVANAKTTDLKEISRVICKGSIDGERYRIGHSKIFFRAGMKC